MNQIASKQVRILALAPSARGFGYCVMEDQVMLECGNKGVKGNKNQQSVPKIEKLMKQFLPSILVLHDMEAKGSRRAPRIKTLNQQIKREAKKYKLEVKLISGNTLRKLLLGNLKGTKHEMAEMLARTFPVELAGKLPRKRRPWENVDGRMDAFDAVGLAVAIQSKRKI
jgi:hypothetical protein